MAAVLKGEIDINAESVDRASDKWRAFGRTIESFFARQTGAGRRAELAITGSIRELISGDIIGGVERLASRMSTLGLGGGIAVGAIATAVTFAHRQLKAFDEELVTTGKLLAKMPEAAAGLDVLKKHVTDLLAAIKPRETGKMGFLGTALSTLGDVGFGGATERRQAEGVAQHKDKVDEIVKSLTAQREKTVAVTDAQKQELALAERVAAIHAEQKNYLTEIISKHLTAAETQKLIHQVNMTAIAEEKKARSEPVTQAAAAIAAKTGVTMEELQAAGQLAPNRGFQLQRRQSFPTALQGDAYLANVAARIEAKGEEYRAAGLREPAALSFLQAREIRRQIGGLSEAEKEKVDPAIAFKGAIEAAEVLKAIKTSTAATVEEVKKIDFTNK